MFEVRRPAGWPRDRAAWQLVEEYPSAVPIWSSAQGEEDHDTTVERSYAYGNSIDEVLTMRDHGSGEDFFSHQDDLFSVYAVTDEDGVVVERYEYGDYGQVSITAEDGTPRAASSHGNRHTFTGRLLCDELTLDDGGQVLEYRNRYMMTGSGRFVQRDPLGYIDGPNLYTYVRLRPVAYVDPYGHDGGLTIGIIGICAALITSYYATGCSINDSREATNVERCRMDPPDYVRCPGNGPRIIRINIPGMPREIETRPPLSLYGERNCTRKESCRRSATGRGEWRPVAGKDGQWSCGPCQEANAK